MRRQLTLFADGQQAEAIEQVRQRYNPQQYALIAAHVTLCREDEIDQNLPLVLANLQALRHAPLVLALGPPTRFEAGGKGLWLPATPPATAFHQLRRQVLAGVVPEPRLHQPHLTLMHPRNATCTNAGFAAISQLPLPTQLSFGTISLIQQQHGGPWKTLQAFPLCGEA